MKTNHENDTMTSGAATHTALLERLVGDSVSLGRVWTSYGLEAGRQVLASTAKTLELTAGMLERLGQELGAERQGAKAKAATGTTTAEATTTGTGTGTGW